jgi:hypothetical protein
MTTFAQMRDDWREYWELRARHYMTEAREAKRVGLPVGSVAGWVLLARRASRKARGGRDE